MLAKMFNPIKLKFKKEHKSTFKNKEYSINKCSLTFGDFGLVARSKGVLHYKELDAAKKAVSKQVKGVGLVFLRVKPDRPKTEKKKGMRMGKGKGAVSKWVVNITAGMVLLEVFGLIEAKSIKGILRNSAARLSITTRNLFFWPESKPFK
jgi:large subunit ribosomal protein L16